MKISPLGASNNTIGAVTGDAAAMSPVIRSLKMSTNANPTDASFPEELTKPDHSEPPAVEATKPLSPQLAQLAKQRRALQLKEREIADKEKALSSKEMVDLARLKSDPIGVLLDSGVTYDQLAEAVMAKQSGITPEIQALKAEIKSLKEGVDKNFSDRDSQSKQQALAEMRRDALAQVAEGDTFEMVRETRSVPKAIELIERVYDDTGEIMDVADALGEIEKYLVTKSLRLAKINKVQSQLLPPPAPMPQQQQRQMRTLTNRDTSSVPISARQRAIAVFNGTLRK